jgi:hypothetical protein
MNIEQITIINNNNNNVQATDDEEIVLNVANTSHLNSSNANIFQTFLRMAVAMFLV